MNHVTSFLLAENVLAYMLVFYKSALFLFLNCMRALITLQAKVLLFCNMFNFFTKLPSSHNSVLTRHSVHDFFPPRMLGLLSLFIKSRYQFFVENKSLYMHEMSNLGHNLKSLQLIVTINLLMKISIIFCMH